MRPFTEADDIAGFHAARGILTAAGRQGLPRRARRPRHGPPLRRRRLRGQGRRRGRAWSGSARSELAAGDLIAIEGTTGKVTADDVPLIEPEIGEHFAEVLALVGRAAPARGAGQRRYRRGRGQGAIPRSRGDRPLPDRAHVLRRGPGRAGAGDVRRRRPLAARRGPRGRGAEGRRRPSSRAPARSSTEALDAAGRAAARRLRGDPARDARPAGDGPAARSAAARVPSARALRGRGAPARGGGRRSAHRCPRGGRDRPRPAGGEPDARDAGGAPRLPLPADLRDAGPGGDRRRRRGGGGRRHPARRDHDPAGRLRDRASPAPRARGQRRRGGATEGRQARSRTRSGR